MLRECAGAEERTGRLTAVLTPLQPNGRVSSGQR